MSCASMGYSMQRRGALEASDASSHAFGARDAHHGAQLDELGEAVAAEYVAEDLPPLARASTSTQGASRCRLVWMVLLLLYVFHTLETGVCVWEVPGQIGHRRQFGSWGGPSASNLQALGGFGAVTSVCTSMTHVHVCTPARAAGRSQ